MGKRILVADDSRTIQQAFAMVMEGSGYTLSFAKSVDEALAVAKRDGRPDLVLSDATLGTGSGYDLCAQLKADAGLRDIIVYILASVQTPYDDARGRKVGADGHLAKPFESQALLDAVSSALATPPPRLVSGSMAGRSTESGSTARYAEDDVLGEEDSYGEITIERSPSAASGGGSWGPRPPSRPPAARPPAVAQPTPATATAPRAPVLGGARPTAGTPVAATPSPPSLAPAQPRHTVMGFPSARPPAVGRSAAPAVPVTAAVPPTPSRPATLGPAAGVPMRPPVLAPPTAAPPPVVARPTPSPPAIPGSMPGMPPRPVVSRFAPPAPSVPEPLAPASPAPPITRRSLTPPPPAAAVVEPPSGPLAPQPITAITDKIEQKMAALASRGPEYEAIAKLSREIIEQVVWEVVPELAEVIIRQEVDRLASKK